MTDLIEAYEVKRWPLGKAPGGKGQDHVSGLVYRPRLSLPRLLAYGEMHQVQ